VSGATAAAHTTCGVKSLNATQIAKHPPYGYDGL